MGFRGGCVHAATTAGAGGWVRNLADGSVEVHLEGSESAVEHVLTWLHSGPAHASVSVVDITTTESHGYREFVVR